MLDKCAGYVADLLSENQIVSDRDKDVFAYGLEVIFSTVVNLLVITLLGFIFGLFPETVLFFVSFAVLRMYAGGYHAKTHIGCITTFTMIYLVNVALVNWTPETLRSLLSLVLSLIALVFIWVIAPVEHKNRPFEGDEFFRFRNISRIVVLTQSAIIGTLNLFYPGNHYSYCMALALLSVVFVVTLAKIKK